MGSWVLLVIVFVGETVQTFGECDKYNSSISNFLYYVTAEIRDKQLKGSEDFVWALEVPLTGKFIIDVEFLDLKTASLNVILSKSSICLVF